MWHFEGELKRLGGKQVGIRIVLTENAYTPTIVCDQCSMPIRNTDHGKYAWLSYGYVVGSQYDVVFLHRDGCERLYRLTRNLNASDWSIGELGHFMKFLAMNTPTPPDSPLAEIRED
jgi:hypothetical protein